MAVTQTSPNLGLVLPGTTSPDNTNPNDTIALLTAALLQADALAGLQADTGTANTYVVALSPVTTLYAGLEINFKAAHACTGASTFNLNGAGAKAITKQGATALASGDILANGVYKIVYDGTEWQLLNPVVD